MQIFQQQNSAFRNYVFIVIDLNGFICKLFYNSQSQLLKNRKKMTILTNSNFLFKLSVKIECVRSVRNRSIRQHCSHFCRRFKKIS